MSISYLTADAMIAVTQDLLKNIGKRSLLDAHPMTASVTVYLDEVHNELILLSRSEGVLQARIQDLTAQLTVCDQTHDRFNRGMYGSLEAAADFARTPEEGAVFIEVRDLIYDRGLAINSLSYHEQAGNVVKVAAKVTEKEREVLRLIQFNGRTLEDVFDSWVENGKLMGKLLAERAALSGETDDTRVSPSDLRHGRQRWIRAVNTLLATLEMIEMPPDDQRRLLANLHDAETKATRSRAAEQEARAKANEEKDENEIEDSPMGDLPDDTNDPSDPSDPSDPTQSWEFV